MTSQAIEGTGMTLTMSGGWTSDITEMQLPYSVRQAIDDTHLGDTIIRWVPSQKIEHGTMAIRFWHDPARQLPITGDPEMMVITYPDGVNHLTVVGFVEKIGKESIKVGELMQTDALVRVIEYPKAESISNGSFPIITGALTGKVVTDIIETATLRYLVDTTPASPVKAAAIISTIPPGTVNLPHDSGVGYIRSAAGKVFGKRGFYVQEENGPGSYKSTPYPAGKTITDFTMACILRLGPYITTRDVFSIGLRTQAGGYSGIQTMGVPSDNFSILIGGQTIWTTYPAELVLSQEKGFVALCLRRGGITRVIVNNAEKIADHKSVTPVVYDMSFFCADLDAIQFNHAIRDWAFWDTALSDSDFETLNDQLCAEYGTT